MTQTLEDRVHRLEKVAQAHEDRLDALDGSHSRPGPVKGTIKAPIPKPKDTWILKPNNRLRLSCNGGVFTGRRPGMGRHPNRNNPSWSPGFLDHIDLCNDTGAEAFLYNVAGPREIAYIDSNGEERDHHHDGVWDWWAKRYGQEWASELMQGFFEALNLYEPDSISLYLCDKWWTGILNDLHDVDEDRVRTRWMGQIVPQIRQATRQDMKVSLPVDAMPNRREFWSGVARDILTPAGVRTESEASWADVSDPEFLRVPQVFLWQHMGNREWMVADLPHLAVKGSVSLWLTNHAWKRVPALGKVAIIRALWERGYGLVLEYDDLKANIDWLRDNE